MNKMDDLMLPPLPEPEYKDSSLWEPTQYTADQMLDYAKKAVESERERHRMQMVGICTAAIGYWKESDGIHPDYDTIALRDVAKLYAKYDELYRAQPAPVAKPHEQEPVACFIGAKNSAFDLPETKRAYTYKEQPGNVVASKLGRACNEAGKQRAGDNIDRGLGLLQELQKEGFGVFALGGEYTVTQQEPTKYQGQAAFEDWLARTCPSGDTEAVQRQWESSSEYIDLYTSPPPVATQHERTWVWLTDEEINDLVKEFDGLPITLSYAIEDKLKEKNT